MYEILLWISQGEVPGAVFSSVHRYRFPVLRDPDRGSLSGHGSYLIELFDTSNFETDHPMYSTQNHRVLGKFKSETGSMAPAVRGSQCKKCIVCGLPGPCPNVTRRSKVC